MSGSSSKSSLANNAQTSGTSLGRLGSGVSGMGASSTLATWLS